MFTVARYLELYPIWD